MHFIQLLLDLNGGTKDSAKKNTPELLFAWCLNDDPRSALALLDWLAHAVDRVVLGWQCQWLLGDTVCSQLGRLGTISLGFTGATASLACDYNRTKQLTDGQLHTCRASAHQHAQ